MQDKPATLDRAEHGAFPAIDPGTRIGHVHLKVADLDRALGFYGGVLGFEATQRRPGSASARSSARICAIVSSKRRSSASVNSTRSC